MTRPVLQTKAEQKLDYLKSLKRPLTDKESDELRRSMHAVYERERRLGMIAMNRREELELLDRLRTESTQPEWYPHQ